MRMFSKENENFKFMKHTSILVIFLSFIPLLLNSQVIKSESKVIIINNQKNKPADKGFSFRWIFPVEETEITRASKIKIRFRVYGKANADSFIILNNSKQHIKTKAANLKKESQLYETEIELNEGYNEIKIIASTASQSDTSKIRKIVFKNGAIREKRFAMVIENYAYGNEPINIMGHESFKDISAVLKDYGFDVISFRNLDKDGIQNALKKYEEISRYYEVVFFYYYGHSFQKNDRNYILPLNTKIIKPDDIKHECISFASVLRTLNATQRQTNIVVIDGISELPDQNLFYETLDIKDGLSPVFAPDNFLVALTASPGRTIPASILKSRLFTKSFLEIAQARGLKIQFAFDKIQKLVYKNSKGRQNMWFSELLDRDFYMLR